MRSSRPRSDRSSSRTTTPGSSTIACQVGPDRLRGRWHPAGRLGGAAGRDATAGPGRRLAAVGPARRVRGSTTPRTSRWPSSASTLAAKGPACTTTCRTSSIIGNFPTVLMMRDFGTEAQKASGSPGFLDGSRRLAFGLTEAGPRLGRDLPRDDGRARRRRVGHQRPEAVRSGLHRATHDIVFARTSVSRARRSASARCWCRSIPGLQHRLLVDLQHAHRSRRVTMTDVRIPAGVRGGRPGPRTGAALRAREPHPPGGLVAGGRAVLRRRGRRLRERPGHLGQAPVAQPGHPVPARRAAHRRSDAAPADPFDRVVARPPAPHGGHPPGGHVQLPGQPPGREGADRAMQTCGGMGYTRHMPFEHIYRHHRRYRSEGSEEIRCARSASSCLASAQAVA